MRQYNVRKHGQLTARATKRILMWHPTSSLITVEWAGLAAGCPNRGCLYRPSERSREVQGAQSRFLLRPSIDRLTIGRHHAKSRRFSPCEVALDRRGIGYIGYSPPDQAS